MVLAYVNFKQSYAFIDLMETEDFMSVLSNNMNKAVKQKLISAWESTQRLLFTSSSQKDGNFWKYLADYDNI